MSDETMINQLIKQFAKDRAEAIEKELWRMIGDGCLLTDGWGLAVIDTSEPGRTLAFTLIRMPPELKAIPHWMLPLGCDTYGILRY